MLSALQYPFCIASSGPPEKIALALSVTKLASHFGKRTFSAYVVGSWKPHPGLLLHAASAMAFAPEHCVVVEDSPVGLEAAAAAGMRSLHYAPRGTAEFADTSFANMPELPALLLSMAGTEAIIGKDRPSPTHWP